MMHRVALDFWRGAFEDLQRIRRLAGAQSYAELIRDALRFFDWYHRRRSEGWDVYAYDDRRELESRPGADFDVSVGLKPLPANRRRWWEGWW